MTLEWIPAKEHEKVCKKNQELESRNQRIRQLSAARAAVLSDWYERLLELGWDCRGDLAGLGVAIGEGDMNDGAVGG